MNPKFKIDVRSLQWSSFLEQNQAGKTPLYLGAWRITRTRIISPFLAALKGYFPGKQRYVTEWTGSSRRPRTQDSASAKLT